VAALAEVPDTAVVLVSGRALSILRELSGAPASVHLVGSHGAEFTTGFGHDVDEALLDRITTELEAIAADRPGVTVEPKVRYTYFNPDSSLVWTHTFSSTS
jgi:trehalose 6-phosphate phosphatase